MAAWHASWLAMLAMRRRSRSRCSAVLSCNRTQLLSLSQVSFHRSTHSHLISSVATTSSASGKRPGIKVCACVHRSLTQIRAASVRDPCRHTGHENEAAWRSVLWFYRPPAATPLSLSPNRHFQPPRCSSVASPCRSLLATGLT